MDSFELLKSLKKEYEIKTPFWWPNAGSFEVIIGAILTQQTKWENVEKSLKNLKNRGILSLKDIANEDELILCELIRPCGFYRQKAKRIKLICQNIISDFETFENFFLHANREWLLNQKGIGFESADAILNYACKKEVFVVDSYTNRLLKNLDFCFESYDEIQKWVISGLDKRVYTLYPKDTSLAEIYARMHGKIVMFCKENLRANRFIKLLV